MSTPKEISLLCYGKVGSEMVLLPEGRKMPGLLLQGDKLLNIRALLNELKFSLVSDKSDDSPEDICEELLEIVTGYINIYKSSLEDAD